MVPCDSSLKVVYHWKGDPEALVELETLLYHPDKAVKDFVVNSLQKWKIGKEMRMNIQIIDYEVDSVIQDLGSDVNIMTKKPGN